MVLCEKSRARGQVFPHRISRERSLGGATFSKDLTTDPSQLIPGLVEAPIENFLAVESNILLSVVRLCHSSLSRVLRTHLRSR